MGPTPLIHRLTRWLWIALGTAALAGLVATLGVTAPLDDPPSEPGAEEDTARPEIVGGRAARPGEHPYAVALLRRGTENPFNALFCGGSLVGPDVVLTAAHCVDRYTAAQVDVLVGTNQLQVGGQRIGAQQIHIHPDYQRASAANDVAVVELKAFAEPARLVVVADPAQAPAWAPGTVGTVIGWGATKTHGFPSALRTVDVPVVSDESCRSSYGRRILEEVMVCAGYDGGGRDSCDGDSGGPLLVPGDTGPLQVGIVSWGYGCALPGLPGVYAEAAALREFLGPYLEGFRDVPRWVEPAVAWMSTTGIADGFPDRRFRPDDTLTRAQAVHMLHGLTDPSADAVIDVAHPFGDVPRWIDEAVRWASTDPDGDGPAQPAMSGYADATFRPERPMSRAEFARLQWRLAGSPAAPTHGFADVGNWVSGAVSWMVADEVATGWPDGTFRPDSPLTRAQASRMLYRLHAPA